MNGPASLRLIAAGDPLVRQAEVVRVIDGDTFEASLVLWPAPRVLVVVSVRVLGINAPDKGEGGYDEATRELTTILGEGRVTLQAVKVDKYGGRVDAVVLVQPVVNVPGVLVVVDEMVAAGVAVEWDGKGVRPLVPWPPTHGPYAAPPP